MKKIKTVWLAPIIGAAVATFACMAHADDLIVKKTLEKSSGDPGESADASKGDTTFVSSPAAPAAAPDIRITVTTNYQSTHAASHEEV